MERGAAGPGGAPEPGVPPGFVLAALRVGPSARRLARAGGFAPVQSYPEPNRLRLSRRSLRAPARKASRSRSELRPKAPLLPGDFHR